MKKDELCMTLLSVSTHNEFLGDIKVESSTPITIYTGLIFSSRMRNVTENRMRIKRRYIQLEISIVSAKRDCESVCDKSRRPRVLVFANLRGCH